MSKTALVTGASSGIGDATVRALIEDGYEVFAGARRLEEWRRSRSSVPDSSSSISPMTHPSSRPSRRSRTRPVGSTFWSTMPGTAASARSRTCRSPKRGASSKCACSASPACASWRVADYAEPGGRAHRQRRLDGREVRRAFRRLVSRGQIRGRGPQRLPAHGDGAVCGVSVIVVEPGTIRTEFSRIAGDSLIRASGEFAYAPYARRHAKMLARNEASRVPSSPEGVARTIVRAVRVARPRARYPTGAAARPMLFLRRVAPDRMFDWLMWRISQSFG